MSVSCSSNREAQLQKLQRHRQHYKQIYPQVRLKAQRLVRKQIWKLNSQIKALTKGGIMEAVENTVKPVSEDNDYQRNKAQVKRR